MLYEITLYRLNAKEKHRRRILLFTGIVGVTILAPTWMFIDDDVNLWMERLLSVAYCASLQFFALAVLSSVALLGSRAIERSWEIGRGLAGVHFFGAFGMFIGVFAPFIAPFEGKAELVDWIFSFGLGLVSVFAWMKYTKMSLNEGI